MNTICFGEILWDILPNRKVPGGAPMNVCYHLNQLHQTAGVISKIGIDSDGRDLIDFLQKNRVNTSLIQTTDQYKTGVVIAKQNGNEMEYDIVQPVAWDMISFTENAAQRILEASYFVYGSLAARNNTSKEALVHLLEFATIKIMDINLRPPHYEKSTIEELLIQADILKINNHELSIIANWYIENNNPEEQVQFLSNRFSIPTIIITKGDAGASLWMDSCFYHHPGYRVVVADTIGSGDAFLAGFISQYDQKKEPEAILDFACKLGAFVASKNGACPSYTLSDLNS